MDIEYNVVFLPKANRNLLDIDDYLSQFYPSTSANFFKELDKKISLLQTMPYIGGQYKQNKKYRRIIVGEYLVFYIVDDKRKTIEIHRILHSSRNITQHL